jgi:hypothetical protein
MRRYAGAMKLPALLIACLILLPSCEPSGRGSLCDDGPIYVAAEDVLTPLTARAILAHNMRWQAICR